MKKEFGTEKPASIKEQWPGQFDIFSWIEYVANIPYPMFIITTIKESGKPNANLWSWGFFTGEGNDFYSIISLLRSTHTCSNIMRTKEWCINVPTADYQDQCMETIEHNGMDNDEIRESGFTVEPSVVIESPRIKECPISLECRLEWTKRLFPGSAYELVVGKIAHIAIDPEIMALSQIERVEKLSIMYNIRAQLNPATGEASAGEGFFASLKITESRY